MEMRLCTSFLICISTCFGFSMSLDLTTEDYDRSAVQGPEHALYQHIVDHYKPDSRPVRNASDVVVVTFALSLNQLLDLDEKNQVLSTSVWIYEEWKDELLIWSAEDFNDQQTLMIPARSIWLPDIFIFNAAGDTTDGFIHVNGSKVAVQNSGHVRWMVPLMVNSACAVDVTYFPYDRQTCTIKFGSWIYDISQLDIILDAFKPDLDHYVMNSEYDLENVSLSRGILDSSCCAGDGQHPMIELQIKLKRKSLFYDYIVIAPTIMLCVLTLASFLLPCDKGEKIAIGLTVFLTLYVLQLRIADNVPDTNSTPILGVFMLVVMTFNCVSLIMATVVMNIKKRGDITQCPEVPSWLFALCDKVLGRVVCTLWKNSVPIPLYLLEEFVEHETAFDGPDTLTQDLKSGGNCSEELGADELESRPSLRGKIDGNSFDDNRDNDMDGYYSTCNNERKHVQFDTKDDDDATEMSVLHNEETPTLELGKEPHYDSEEEDKEYQVRKELRDKFKTHHPNLRHSVNSKRRKRRAVPEEESIENAEPHDDESIDSTGETQENQPLSFQSTCDSVRQRKRQILSQDIEYPPQDELKIGSHDELQQECGETESFLPWSAGDAPALEQARRVNLRKRRWYYVAEVVDKFAFFVYLILLTVSIFTVLFLIPVTFRRDDA